MCEKNNVLSIDDFMRYYRIKRRKDENGLWISRSEWELRNQDVLEDWYERDLAKGILSKIRKTQCCYCGKVFYTEIKSKKYCDNRICGEKALKIKRRIQRYDNRVNTICQTCGKSFTPKRSDAIYCSSACRQKAYRKNCAHNINEASYQNEYLH